MIYVIFILYILVINIIGYYLMYIDKNKAKKGNYRISEKSIFMVSFLIGATGVYIGMYKFRHKTKHLTFTVGIPFFIVLNVLTVWYIIYNNLLIKLANILEI